ncbi:MAG: phosphoglycerate kinase [Alphaproteobacteria bacterium]|nr:MAG: phosphoglycerate kinase [Alphaproteobacteria bacterium]
MKTLNDLKGVKGKLILLRLDLNVPVDDAGNVTDTTRIDRAKETVLALKKKGANVAILSHFGRPKGQKDMAYSLSFLPSVLEKQWGVPVGFIDDCLIDPKGSDTQITLMENVRFYEGEEACTPDFVSKIAGGHADIFVNDAFSVSHRAHASTEGLAHALPSYAGFAMEKELDALNDALGEPERPVAAIVGGAKISTKLDVLYNLVEKVDILILGGGMANTFLYALGAEMGQSLCEKDMKDQVLSIFEKAEETGCSIMLPMDGKAAEEFKAGAVYDEVPMTAVPENRMILDAGSQSVEAIKSLLSQCKTLVWNGPMGAFEIEPFDGATNDIARYAAQLTKAGSLKTIAGGGDTVAALAKAGVVNDMTYVSTAGGAFLEWLEGKDLPAITALEMMDEEE